MQCLLHRLETDNNIGYTFVCANNEASNADQDQNDVLPQMEFDAAEIVGPQHADLHKRWECDAEHRETERTEQRDEECQARHRNGQQDYVLETNRKSCYVSVDLMGSNVSYKIGIYM